MARCVVLPPITDGLMAVVGALRDAGGPLRVVEIVERAHVARSTVQRHLSELGQLGHVAATAGGPVATSLVWRLTDSGRVAAAPILGEPLPGTVAGRPVVPPMRRDTRAVLVRLAGAGGPLAVDAIAAEPPELASGTVHRIVKDLVHCGWAYETQGQRRSRRGGPPKAYGLTAAGLAGARGRSDVPMAAGGLR